MRHTISVAVLLAFSLASPSAQQPAAPEVAVDKVFAGYDKPSTPGCAVGVIRGSKLIHARGYGLANLEYDIPLTSKTVFDIGSTSKQFTAAAILLLEQQGKLSIDDDIRKYLPELPSYGHTLTIRHLLNHTSGIRDYLTLMSVAGVNFDGVTTDDDALKIIVRQKALNFSPGTEHLYSNSGYFLLSVIVKRAAGKSLREYAQEQIFVPLGMSDTHFHDDHTMPVPRRATGYAPRQKGGYRIDMSGFEQTGDGAVYTTIEDLAKWDRNFYEPKVGGQRLIDALLHRTVLKNGQTLDYAAGLVSSTYKGLPAVSHGGSWAGYRADMLRFPAQQFSVICLCNRADGNPSAKARQVADVYLGQQLTAAQQPSAGQSAGPAHKPVSLSAAELEAHAGVYRNRSTGMIRRIQFVDGSLRAGGQRLVPLGAQRFAIDSVQPEMVLVFSRGGTGQQMSVVRGGEVVETLEQLQAPAYTPEVLARYAGTYYSEELDVTVTLAVDNGALYYRGPSDPERLEVLTNDTFSNGSLQIEMTRDPSANVDGFLLHAGRIRGLRFARRN